VLHKRHTTDVQDIIKERMKRSTSYVLRRVLQEVMQCILKKLLRTHVCCTSEEIPRNDVCIHVSWLAYGIFLAWAACSLASRLSSWIYSRGLHHVGFVLNTVTLGRITKYGVKHKPTGISCAFLSVLTSPVSRYITTALFIA